MLIYISVPTLHKYDASGDWSSLDLHKTRCTHWNVAAARISLRGSARRNMFLSELNSRGVDVVSLILVLDHHIPSLITRPEYDQTTKDLTEAS